MEFLLTGALFSKQGRATIHMYPTLYLGAKRSPKTIEKSGPIISNLRDLPNSPEQVEEKPQLTSSFRAVSREQYEFAFRNRTKTPGSTAYKPKDDMVHPRTAKKSPVYHASMTRPKQRIIYVPACLTPGLSCTHGQSKKRKSHTLIQREPTLWKDYRKKIELKQKQTPVKESRMKNIVDFSHDTERTPFVNPNDPPNPERFNFNYPDSNVFSKNKRPKTVGFHKQLPRGELFKLGLPLDTYKRNEEATMRKLSTHVLSFEKVPGRNNSDLHDSPEPKDPEKLEIAFERQSHVRGVVQIPKMDSTVPRDDSMYRVKEMYNMNVPIRQTHTCVPKFGGSEPLMKVPSNSSVNPFIY